MVKLNKNVRLVMLQFRFSNSNAIPKTIKSFDQEKPAARANNRNGSSGEMVIEPTENVSLVYFLNELEMEGYEMVKVGYMQRANENDPSGRSLHHVVRFVFARQEFAEPSEELKKAQDAVHAELKSICEDAMWRVRSFSNPFYSFGQEVPGQRAVSVNMEGRMARFNTDGSPVMVWRKDSSGKRVGIAPQPLKAHYCLHVVDSRVQLRPTTASIPAMQ